MTRTRPITMIVFAVFGGAAGWLLEVALSATGSPSIVPPYTLAIALAAIGAIVVALAMPIRRAVREHEQHKIDPFYATRVVVLAKASSVAGALIAGAGAGVLVFLLTRSVVPGVGSILMAVATIVGAIVLLAGGVVAEYMCSVPPDDHEGEESPTTVRPH